MHTSIDLPEQILTTIVSLIRDARPTTAEAGARSLCADMMHGIGSASKLWRRLAKGVLMGDELAWLIVTGAATAAECMDSFPTARSLRIVGNARAGDVGAVLGSRSVTRLEIVRNNVICGCDGLGQLVGLRALCITECVQLRDVAALSSLVGLRTLDLCCCSVRAASLAPSLRSMARLSSLSLGDNDIETAGVLLMAPILAEMSELTSLDLGRNGGIDAAGASSLGPSLARMSQLTSLNLSYTNLRAAGTASLAPSFALTTKLTSLDLSGNELEAAGAAALAPSLARMVQMKSLNLGSNAYGPAGSASLAPSLALMEQLTSLNLSCNGIDAAGAAALAPSLARMAQMTLLDLEGNSFGPAGLASLAPSLAQMVHLQVRRVFSE